MPDRAPVEVTNLDRYGSPPLPWRRPPARLVANPAQPGTSYFLGTSRPDGRPHAAGIGALWDDGDLYFTSGPGTRKARELAANPACTFSVGLAGIDLVLEGEAARVTDPPVLERLAGRYRELGWAAEGEGEGLPAPFSAPTAIPRAPLALRTLNLGLVQRGSVRAQASDLGGPGGQGRDRTADLAVFSRWTRCAAMRRIGDCPAQLACSRASLVSVGQDSR